MKKQMICCYTVIAMLLGVFCSSFSVHADYNSEEETIMDTITGFYETMIDAYRSGVPEKATAYLDMTEVQSQNIVTALDCISYSRSYMQENYGIYSSVGECVYNIMFNDISFPSERECIVKIHMHIQPGETYPPFLSEGDEIFMLSKDTDQWKIYRHEWNGIDVFEIDYDEVYQYSKTERALLLDEIASWKPDPIDYTNHYNDSDYISQKNDTEKELTRVTSIPSGNYSYNPVHGVSYAVDTATTVNPIFYHYIVDGESRDCTNFVSQCVAYGFHNGGYRFLYTSYYTSIAWYPVWNLPSNNMWLVPDSWVGVNEFWAFATSNQNYGGRRFWFAAEPTPSSGCVIQFYIYSDNNLTWKHSAILYSDGPIWKVAQHSPFNCANLSDLSFVALRYLVPKVLYVD